MAPDDDLDRWISDLRGHVERGDLIELPPFDIGDGTLCLPGETTVWTMLADLKDLDDPHGSAARDPDWHDGRWRDLRADFLRLRELLG